MNFDWYPFNPTDFRRDTYHLSAAADGIYRRLIDEYMQTRTPLPDSDAALAGIARVTIDEWNDHREAIRAFFVPKSGKLYHKRCQKELDAQCMHHALRSRIGKLAATVRWAKLKQYERDKCMMHASPNAYAMHPDATRQEESIEGNPTKEENAITATPTLVNAMRQKKWVR